jgi:serine/threonine-protein kinase HipA
MEYHRKLCYICGKKLNDEMIQYHTQCSLSLFNSSSPPVIEYSWQELNALAADVIRNHISVPGVQPKLSLHIEKNGKNGARRLTIVGFEGAFILKPPTEEYPELPQSEHFCMTLAALCGIETAAFGLIPLKTGELAYITRRMDRLDDELSLHMEDFCQLTNKLTESKYRGSMEQIGKIIRQFSSVPGLDIVRFFEIALFSFLTGNSDMHLKNFSVCRFPDGRCKLSPAYDLLPVKVILPADQEELALTLNGKKRRLAYNDFEIFGKTLKMTERQITNAFKRIIINLKKYLPEALDCSFLTDGKKIAISQLAEERLNRLNRTG